MPFGAVDPYDESTVAAMVRTLRPAWTIDSVESISQGTDALYRVTAETDDGTGSPVVLKSAEYVDTERFLREPRTLSLVAEHTDVPVAEVIGVAESHPELPAPFFCMRAVGGVDGNTGEALDDHDRLERLAVDSGRALAALHDAWAGEPEGFGWADPRADTFVVADGEPTWADHYRTMVCEGALDHLDGGRFADLVPRVRDEVDSLAEPLPEVEPVVRHNDWRPGNLRIDPDDGSLVAALDWGAVATGHDEYELAAVEESLSGRAPLDAPERERVRRGLREGYTERRALPSGAAAERRRLAYLLASRVTAMRWLDQWHADASDDERDRIAAAHRAFVESALERLSNRR